MAHNEDSNRTYGQNGHYIRKEGTTIFETVKKNNRGSERQIYRREWFGEIREVSVEMGDLVDTVASPSVVFNHVYTVY